MRCYVFPRMRELYNVYYMQIHFKCSMFTVFISYQCLSIWRSSLPSVFKINFEYVLLTSKLYCYSQFCLRGLLLPV